MPRSLRPLSLLVTLALGACTDEVEHVDTGRACVRGAPEQAHEVSVDFGLCLSSSCDEVVESSCTATLDGDTIVVEASATVRSSSRGPCTLDCRPAVASCQTPPLAEGTYTIVYGEDQVPLTVPLGDQSTCTAEEEL